DLQAFKQSTGFELPDDVKESYLVHDGQIERVGPGALLGQPIDPLLTIRRHCKKVARFFKKFGTSDWTLEYGTSFPKDAIKTLDQHPGWIPLHDWDGNYYGIDLDPGPRGVCGQMINFGPDAEHKYVLAISWAHFLEDLADELESGNIEVT